MKKLKALKAELAESGILTDGVMPSAARVTVTAAKRLMLENHRGILSYSAEHIAVASPNGKINIYGTTLKITAMSVDTLIVSGKIATVEFE